MSDFTKLNDCSEPKMPIPSLTLDTGVPLYWNWWEDRAIVVWISILLLKQVFSRSSMMHFCCNSRSLFGLCAASMPRGKLRWPRSLTANSLLGPLIIWVINDYVNIYKKQGNIFRSVDEGRRIQLWYDEDNLKYPSFKPRFQVLVLVPTSEIRFWRFWWFECSMLVFNLIKSS